jgi:hypothetical protein
MPGMILLVLLLWEFAYLMWSRMVVSSATFEGARVVATGGSVREGYNTYREVLEGSLGRMAQEQEGYFALNVQPQRRSVWAETHVPYRWPTGLGALMGGQMQMTLDSSAFFRLEQFYGGPPQEWE